MACRVTSLVPRMSSLYDRILSIFPQECFQMCFAYGSGVLKQAGTPSSTQPMIDLVFVVDDSALFHERNMTMNPTHYSGLRHLGHNVVSKIQEWWPAKVYYNTLINLPEEGVCIKYGVTSSKDFVDELLDWNYLYLSGRLHKPVQFIVPPSRKEFKSALRLNTLSALHAALLILPEFFTERQMYLTIANLSYVGDFRMVFGEDKNKVKNIVDGQFNYFRALYVPFLLSLSNLVHFPYDETGEQTCSQDIHPLTRTFHLNQLPREAQKGIAKHWVRVGGRRIHDTEELLRVAAYYPKVGQLLYYGLRDIVFYSSALQSFKGVFTAGALKSVQYSSRKISKMMKSSPTQ